MPAKAKAGAPKSCTYWSGTGWCAICASRCRMSLFLPALANTVKSAQWCTRRISFMKYASRTAPGNGW
nr:MAG TPA: hypothetical protein [Caudoviricetes sp.]DAU74696.1 MAG TPA: hypothetical protein [Caudoviricetes sp.]